MFPQTKFHLPPVRSEHLERAPLLDAIDRSAARVVVASAPAGFGKSTLLAQWAARAGEPERVAWVSVDADDQGSRLWLAVLTALRPVVGEAIDAARDAAEAPDADLRDGVLIALLDALTQAPEPITLILDDVHLAVADPVTRDSVDWFLARLPHAHRIMLATRRDPELDALTRMRSQGEVLDLRADDLRFGADESRRFLRDALGLTLDDEAAQALERRTEGWPAALYLAALRLRLGDAPADVVAQLHASDEDLIGDLVDEVLASSPQNERRFILETSVLERFNVELCVRLLGDDVGTRAAFTSLTRSSLLLSPLDRSRQWFRCHHLLRDVLRNRLLALDAGRARALHVRAGEWLESEGGEGELQEAMGHYLAARDWDLAAELLACHSIRFVQSGSLGGRAREWLALFPAEVVGADARLCYVSALLAALSGDRDRRDGWLATGERAGWEGPMPDGTASYALAALCLEAMLCFGDLAGAVRAAERALAVLPRGAPVRAAVEALTAWHLHLQGRDAQAERLAHQALQEQVHLPASGLPLVAYLPRAVLALVALRRGDVAEAQLLTDAAVAARDNGPLRASPHALPVVCARAQLLTLIGEPEEAARRCRAGLDLARGWTDSSLVVGAVQLELARALAVLNDHDEAAAVVAAARAQLGDATDAGLLPAALEAVLADPERPYRGTGHLDAAPVLSAREVEVLTALSGPGSLRQVADDLYISRNTIKTHTRTLYAKLGVASRAEAVDRGRALGLLTPAEGEGILSISEDRR
ncbi:LuxR C-terminal-related transcriptional regulator [Baekduia sp. Peel2402]|uniref:LuxR C-terminal-related transcriptional regulator n=1 Tax=Baekduia sp. Peel2402 TaxID=3458296 RepID=UPI00403EA6F6